MHLKLIRPLVTAILHILDDFMTPMEIGGSLSVISLLVVTEAFDKNGMRSEAAALVSVSTLRLSFDSSTFAESYDACLIALNKNV